MGRVIYLLHYMRECVAWGRFNSLSLAKVVRISDAWRKPIWRKTNREVVVDDTAAASAAAFANP